MKWTTTIARHIWEFGRKTIAIGQAVCVANAAFASVNYRGWLFSNSRRRCQGEMGCQIGKHRLFIVLMSLQYKALVSVVYKSTFGFSRNAHPVSEK